MNSNDNRDNPASLQSANSSSQMNLRISSYNPNSTSIQNLAQIEENEDPKLVRESETVLIFFIMFHTNVVCASLLGVFYFTDKEITTLPIFIFLFTSDIFSFFIIILSYKKKKKHN